MAARTGIRKRWAVDRQQLLILLVAAVMMTSFVLLVLWPKQRELTAVGRAVEHERDLMNQKVLASHEGVYVSARIPSLRMAQGAFSRRLPPEPRVAEFLQAVAECMSAEPDVTHEIERADARLSGSTPAIPLRLRLTGPFDAVYRCLVGIEGLQRLSRFREVHFVKAEGRGWVVAQTEILVYYLPDQERPAGPGKAIGDGRAGVGRVSG